MNTWFALTNPSATKTPSLLKRVKSKRLMCLGSSKKHHQLRTSLSRTSSNELRRQFLKSQKTIFPLTSRQHPNLLLTLDLSLNWKPILIPWTWLSSPLNSSNRTSSMKPICQRLSLLSSTLILFTQWFWTEIRFRKCLFYSSSWLNTTLKRYPTTSTSSKTRQIWSSVFSLMGSWRLSYLRLLTSHHSSKTQDGWPSLRLPIR